MKFIVEREIDITIYIQPGHERNGKACLGEKAKDVDK